MAKYLRQDETKNGYANSTQWLRKLHVPLLLLAGAWAAAAGDISIQFHPDTSFPFSNYASIHQHLGRMLPTTRAQ